MKLLEERIKKDGRVFKGDILKIDSFLNHQIDVKLMEEIGKEFYNLFKDSNPDKILTIESSGIAIATEVSKNFGYLPVIFAKKTSASNMDNEKYSSKERSYTRGIVYDVQVAKEFIKEGTRILIIDDFLANGEAMNSLIDICIKAKAEIVGCGAVVSKTYQKGEKRIKDMDLHLEVLARVKKMSENLIEFEA